MKVVLLADVKGQGKKNDVIEVSDGYGRNYLIPRKLAVEADNKILNAIKGQEAAKQHQIEVATAEAKEQAAKLDSVLLKIRANCGADGRLYGSITTKEIAEALEKEYGIKVDKRKIQLDEAIRAYGKYDMDVKLYADIVGHVHVLVCN
ncbi:MAG: 50S ribosomal protein L9 [Clostridia bacterium]|nr:50S ribosomal protein L9 [Clostridia bacterium]